MTELTTQVTTAGLSAGEKQCLRLVLLHKNSKEIAIDLGVSPHTVDQRLRVAIRKLGVNTRFEAARMLFEAEGNPYQESVYQQQAVVVALPSGESVPVETDGEPSHSEAEANLLTVSREAERAAPAEENVAFALRLDLAIPKMRGEHNGLNVWKRLGVMLLIGFGLTIAFGAFLAGLEALVDLARRSG